MTSRGVFLYGLERNTDAGRTIYIVSRMMFSFLNSYFMPRVCDELESFIWEQERGFEIFIAGRPVSNLFGIMFTFPKFLVLCRAVYVQM